MPVFTPRATYIINYKQDMPAIKTLDEIEECDDPDNIPST